MKVYGASVSYYTGKLEAYLRYKGIAYERGVPYERAAEIKAAVGCIQHPMAQCEDGRWMSDSTPMLLHLESEHSNRCILPDNPVVRFVAMLIEDYADEWLWRAAMHYRWSYEHDSALLSRILADELTGHLRAPRFLRVRMVKKRQLTGFVLNDGVTAQTQEHVELGYRRILDLMSESLRLRPFLLGDSPSIADFGLMGPMLRHFGQDPTPAEIMRDTAPHVFEWLGRVWNAGSTPEGGGFLSEVPGDLMPMLQEACETHLGQLEVNAAAYHAGQKKFAMNIQGCAYSELPVSRYRVYCLEMLREQFFDMSDADQASVRGLLPFDHAQTLWSERIRAESGYDAQRMAPFNEAINVFDDGVPA